MPLVKNNESPLGDGNSCANARIKLFLNVKNNESPLGDGNFLQATV